MSAKPSLFFELRRRNVLRAGVLYIGAVWALAQGISQLGPSFGAPDWLVRWCVAAAAIGFPFWLAFAWFYEWTPQGFKLERELAPGESAALKNHRKLDLAIIAVLALVVVLLLTDRVIARKGASDVAAIPDKSIAVLPFADLSPGRDQEYFSDGMAEEILNALAQVHGLKVAGRTSSFYFKGRNETLQAMANTLGVAHILEGSVRKQGERVRITAQLIRVADDTHLWSHAYDGDLSDVFTLQENIAREITDQLQLVLSGSQQTRLVDAGTANAEAYTLYLQATDALNRRDYALMGKAIGWLQQAIAFDPHFARAQSRLAMIHVLGQDRYGASLSEVEPHAREALALDPANIEAQVALGLLARVQRRFIDSRIALERALSLAPNDAAVHLYAAEGLIDDGYTREGIAHLDHALTIDPLLPHALYWRGRQYLYAGDPDTAERLFKQTDALGLSYASYGLGLVARARGDFARARTLRLPLVVQNAPAVNCPKQAAAETPVLLDGVLGGDAAARDKAAAVLEACLADKPAVVPAIVPIDLMYLGRPERALEVAASPTSDDAGLFMSVWSSEGDGLRRLPGFAAFARKVGFAALWDRYGPPDLCRKNGTGDYVCE